MGELEHKYEVDIKEREGRQKLPDDVKAELKASGMMDDKGKLKALMRNLYVEASSMEIQ